MGQGALSRARDPRLGSGILNQGQGPSIGVRDPQSGPGTINLGLEFSIKALVQTHSLESIIQPSGRGPFSRPFFLKSLFFPILKSEVKS